jgi:hypothetical protein
MTSQKGRVETRGQTSAVVVFGKPVNHVLHLLLTIFTCTLWGPVWLLVAAFSGERRTTVSVDQYGVASQHQAPMPTHRIVLIVIAVLWAVMNFAIPVGIIAVTGSGAVITAIGSLVGHPGSGSSTQTSEPTPSARPGQLPGSANPQLPPSLTSTLPPAPPASDLNVGIPMSHPACDGTGIVVLGNAVTPGRYQADVARLLAANPGASYLRTDQSCPSLRPATEEGNPIYAVYRVAGRTQREVCSAVRAAGGGAYGKWLDNKTDPSFVIPC